MSESSKDRNMGRLGIILSVVVVVLLGITIFDGIVPNKANGEDLQKTPFKNTYIQTNIQGKNKFMDNIATHQPFHSIILHTSHKTAQAPNRQITFKSGKDGFETVHVGRKLTPKEQVKENKSESDTIRRAKAGVDANGHRINQGQFDNNINKSAINK